MREGAAVGKRVVGKLVGLGVGTTDGIALGEGLGSADGGGLGAGDVGMSEGLGDGIEDGLAVGTGVVGKAVGLGDGINEGSDEGFCVGLGVGSQVVHIKVIDSVSCVSKETVQLYVPNGGVFLQFGSSCSYAAYNPPILEINQPTCLDSTHSMTPSLTRISACHTQC